MNEATDQARSERLASSATARRFAEHGLLRLKPGAMADAAMLAGDSY